MAKTLMDMFSGGSFASGAQGAGNAAAGAPQPMPSSMRPPAPGMPDNRRLGERWGWGDNPIYQVWDKLQDSGFIEDLGYGMMTSPDMGSALAAAGKRSISMRPERREEQRQAELRKKYSEILGGWGEEYAPFAAGVADGAMEPAEAYRRALEFKTSRGEEDQENRRRIQNAQFITDPELRGMVEAGALDFKQAYDYQTNGASGGGNRTISTQPQWFTDPESGQPVLGQIANDGTIVRTDTGGLVPMAPYDLNQQRAAGSASGRTQASADAAIPGAAADVQRVAMQIEDLKNHPGLDDIYGKTLGFIPNQWGPTVPGTNKANAMARIEQMSGNAFLNGRQLLKGSGAITDFESKKAEAAFARLSTAQSKDEFLTGLDEFQQALTDGLHKLQMQSSGGAGQSGADGGQYATNPQTGERVMWNGSSWVPAR